MLYGSVPAVDDRWQRIDLSGYVVCIDNVAPSMLLSVHNAHLELSLSLHQHRASLHLAALQGPLLLLLGHQIFDC